MNTRMKIGIVSLMIVIIALSISVALCLKDKANDTRTRNASSSIRIKSGQAIRKEDGSTLLVVKFDNMDADEIPLLATYDKSGGVTVVHGEVISNEDGGLSLGYSIHDTEPGPLDRLLRRIRSIIHSIRSKLGVE